MQIVANCVVCGGELVSHKRARVAPFIAQRVWNRPSFRVSLDACGECGFQFYNPRIEPHEEERLYNNYRSDEYLAQRFKFEPWYTEALNRRLESSNEVAPRVQRLCYLLKDDSVTSVLDFGGGGGQFVSELPINEKFVFDVSGVPVPPGVGSYRDFVQCSRRQYDLVTCTHVLEHVGFPQSIMQQIRELSRPGTLLYIEVPRESAFTPLKRSVQAAAVMLLRPRHAAELLRPGVLRIMHEHINYFSAESLRRLVEGAGFRVLQSSRLQPGDTQGSLWCFAQLT